MIALKPCTSSSPIQTPVKKVCSCLAAFNTAIKFTSACGQKKTKQLPRPPRPLYIFHLFPAPANLQPSLARGPVERARTILVHRCHRVPTFTALN